MSTIIKNSKRYISAFNKIDKALRQMAKLKPSMPFVDVVRKSTLISVIVRRYEDELLSYARLRNAIIHNSDDEPIAEPHDEVTEHIEYIAKILSAPPLASQVSKKAVSLTANASLYEAIKIMTSGGYSNAPVLEGNKVIGALSNKNIVEKIACGYNYPKGLDAFIRDTSVKNSLSDHQAHFLVAPDNLTADGALNLFAQNPKLSIIILSVGGLCDDEITGVLTHGDLVSLNKLLD